MWTSHFGWEKQRWQWHTSNAQHLSASIASCVSESSSVSCRPLHWHRGAGTAGHVSPVCFRKRYPPQRNRESVKIQCIESIQCFQCIQCIQCTKMWQNVAHSIRSILHWTSIWPNQTPILDDQRIKGSKAIYQWSPVLSVPALKLLAGENTGPLGFANTMSIPVSWLRLRNLSCWSGGPRAHLQRLPQNESALEAVADFVACYIVKHSKPLNKQNGPDIITYQ